MSDVTEQFKKAFCEICDVIPDCVRRIRVEIKGTETILHVEIVATDEMLLQLKAELPEANQP